MLADQAVFPHALADWDGDLDETGVAGSEGTVDDAYPDSWFPEIAAAKASAQDLPGSGKVINERKVVN